MIQRMYSEELFEQMKRDLQAVIDEHRAALEAHLPQTMPEAMEYFAEYQKTLKLAVDKALEKYR